METMASLWLQRTYGVGMLTTGMEMFTTSVPLATPLPTPSWLVLPCYEGRGISVYRWEERRGPHEHSWSVFRKLLRGLFPKTGESLAVMIGVQHGFSAQCWYELRIGEDFVGEEVEEEDEILSTLKESTVHLDSCI